MNDFKDVSPSSFMTEHDLMLSIADRVLSYGEFGSFCQDNGFSQFRRGIWRSLEQDKFLSSKDSWRVATETDALQSRECVRFMIGKGILYPETEVGIYKSDAQEGPFSLFAVTRRLPNYSEYQVKGVQGHWQKPTLSIGSDAWIEAISDKKNHMAMWWKRLEQSGEQNKQLLLLLDSVEATHLKNWGWDSRTGKMYPVDAEVINIAGARHQEIIKQWHDIKRQT